MNFIKVCEPDARLFRQWLHSVRVLAGLGLAVLLVPAPGAQSAGYDWQLPAWIKPPPVPSGNPMSRVKVELGRRLFYDIRLSGPGYMACASCHDPRRAFTDGRRVAIGATGERHSLNSPSVVNAGYQGALTWADPGVQFLEKQARTPLFRTGPVEMGATGHEVQIINHLKYNSVYADLFGRAFPKTGGRIDFDTITKALASFQRTLISATSAYDTYRFGNDTAALSLAAKRGERLFFSPRLRCGQCHNGLHLSDAIPHPAYHNTGLHNADGNGGLPPGVKGLIDKTGQPGDMGRFRTPSLRNVAVTDPYMHDGSIADLDAVISHYAAGGEAARLGRRSPLTSARVRGFSITPEERRDLRAFLDSLTDNRFLRDPRHQTPFR
ncbi:MAG TPA: di-heme enzyme [Hyphomicrobiaceae bacterium]|nr:di-heme enzyme [Hyphomicrobiaceae bacterium]